MAIKATKGQLSDGTISKNTCVKEYYLSGKFHGFMHNIANFWGYAAILYNSNAYLLCVALLCLRLLAKTASRFNLIALNFQKFSGGGSACPRPP